MSYRDLLTIREEAKAIAAHPRPMAACPIDGEPLKQGPRGVLYCNFCGRRFGSTATTGGGAGT